MGARFTARLDDDLAEWVETESTERDRPKAWVISEALRAAKGEESTYTHRVGAERTALTSGDSDENGASSTAEHRTDARRTDADRTGSVRDGAVGTSDGDLRDRVEDLEDRVAELEARESARDELAEERYTVDEEADDVDVTADESHAVPTRGDGRAQPSDAPYGGEEDESGDVDAAGDSDDPTPDYDVETLIGDDVDPEVREAVSRAAEWWTADARAPDRVRAAAAVLEAIKENGHGLTKSEIVDRFFEEYAVDGQSERTWWRRNISEGAEDDEAPAPLRLVADYSRGTHKWTWRGLDEE